MYKTKFTRILYSFMLYFYIFSHCSYNFSLYLATVLQLAMSLIMLYAMNMCNPYI